MRLFVYEYTCAVAPDSNLRAEGYAMLSAVVTDFARIPELTVEVLLHPAMSEIAEVSCRRTKNEKTDLQRIARDADFTLVIAPESDGLLSERCRWVEEVGGTLLGAPSAVAERLADKWQCGQFLHEQQIPTPRTMRVEDNGIVPSHVFPAVCKPRRGAGAKSTVIVSNRDELDAYRRSMHGDFIVQQFVYGTAASVLCIAGSNQSLPLSPGEQHLNGVGRLQYMGGAAPLGSELSKRATELAHRVLQSMPAKLGFIGVDMVLGTAKDGSRDYVIEVNPRLTTSYLALRELTDDNIAERLWRMVRGESLKPLRWQDRRVQYRVGNSEKGVELWPIC